MLWQDHAKVTKSDHLSAILTRVLVILFQIMISKHWRAYGEINRLIKHETIYQKPSNQIGLEVLVLLC